VTRTDPNIAQVEFVAAALGSLCDELVLVGGCAAGLLITDPAAPPVRATMDVDLLVSAATRADYRAAEQKFELLGFQHDLAQDAPICRWVHGRIKVDLMPTDTAILGFANRWYPLAIETAVTTALPSGKKIRLISAPAFLACKLEAFHDRGRGDLLASHDLEDIINVIDGRESLLGEISDAPKELRSYLADECGKLLATRDFSYLLPAILNDTDSPPLRAAQVEHRLRAIAERMR
jgi:predicted nucleotidyltransferase